MKPFQLTLIFKGFADDTQKIPPKERPSKRKIAAGTPKTQNHDHEFLVRVS